MLFIYPSVGGDKFIIEKNVTEYSLFVLNEKSVCIFPKPFLLLFLLIFPLHFSLIVGSRSMKAMVMFNLKHDG